MHIIALLTIIYTHTIFIYVRIYSCCVTIAQIQWLLVPSTFDFRTLTGHMISSHVYLVAINPPSLTMIVSCMLVILRLFT